MNQSADPITWTRPEDAGEYGRDQPPERRRVYSPEEIDRYVSRRLGGPSAVERLKNARLYADSLTERHGLSIDLALDGDGVLVEVAVASVNEWRRSASVVVPMSALRRTHDNVLVSAIDRLVADLVPPTAV